MLKFDRFQWLSFDCYGTLVDWETGISGAVAGVLRAHETLVSKREILALFASIEPRVQHGAEFLTYRRVLQRVMARMGALLDITFNEAEENCLVDTIASWPVFPDAAHALRLLKTRYKLAVITNVDDDLFAPTVSALGVEWDAVVTSQQCSSYKPDHNNFRIAQERMGVEKQDWLHIAESLFHDIAPANDLQVPSVWVNRRQADAKGATRPADARPDLEVRSLSELVTAMGLGES